MENHETQSTKIDRGLWRELIKILMHEKKYLKRIIVFILLTATIDVSIPVFNSYAIDTLASGNASQAQFIGFSVLLFVLIVIFGISVYLYLHYTGIVENNFAYNLRQTAFKKVQELSFSYFDKNSEGWIISRLTSDIFRITEILSWGFIDMIYGLTTIVGITFVMFYVNYKLALLVVSVMPILVVVSVWFQKRILIQQRKVRKHNSAVTASFSENINGAQTIKSLALEEMVKDDFYDISLRMKRSAIHANLYSALFIPIVIFMSSVSSAILMWYGGQQVVAYVMPFGVLMMFTSYINSFFQPLREIARLLSELQMAQASAERVMQLIHAENDVVDREDVIEQYGTLLNPKVENYPQLYGDIDFNNVNFYYNDNEIVLDNFNLSVKKGTTVALVGETGSGKSTIINLLCRFYEPTKGEILIDGVNYQDRSLGWLRHNIGYVLQSPHLFSGTIKDNIRYGKLDATDDEIIAAAKRVNAHEFIMNFSDGYNTDVGEGGGRLSTGQKQLISFARAIIKEPSIFILDEATASIDTETELLVQNAIKELLKGRTSFIVAHRLSTIVDSDLILVIRNGKIVESGKHDELLQKEGYYYRLYTNQFQEEMNAKVMNRN